MGISQQLLADGEQDNSEAYVFSHQPHPSALSIKFTDALESEIFKALNRCLIIPVYVQMQRLVMRRSRPSGLLNEI